MSMSSVLQWQLKCKPNVSWNSNLGSMTHKIPIGSMYALYGNIYHQYTPNLSIYTIHGSYGWWSIAPVDSKFDRPPVPAPCESVHGPGVLHQHRSLRWPSSRPVRRLRRISCGIETRDPIAIKNSASCASPIDQNIILILSQNLSHNLPVLSLLA